MRGLKGDGSHGLGISRVKGLKGEGSQELRDLNFFLTKFLF